MSGTTSTTTALPEAPVPQLVSATNSLLNPTFIMALLSMFIVAATVGVVLWKGDDGNTKLVLGFVLGSMGGGVVSFYFGSSKSSQAKDEAMIKVPPATPVTQGTTP